MSKPIPAQVTKPAAAATKESTLATHVSSVQTVLTDKASLQWYADRDIKPSDIQTYLAACTAYQALLTAAGLKVVQ